MRTSTPIGFWFRLAVIISATALLLLALWVAFPHKRNVVLQRLGIHWPDKTM